LGGEQRAQDWKIALGGRERGRKDCWQRTDTRRGTSGKLPGPRVTLRGGGILKGKKRDMGEFRGKKKGQAAEWEA